MKNDLFLMRINENEKNKEQCNHAFEANNKKIVMKQNTVKCGGNDTMDVLFIIFNLLELFTVAVFFSLRWFCLKQLLPIVEEFFNCI